MAKTRRRFSAEFKSKVALEAMKENKTMAELSQEYGIHASPTKEWKEQALVSLSRAFESGNNIRETDRAQEEKDGRLYQNIGQLNIEIDWLKKKMGLP